MEEPTYSAAEAQEEADAATAFRESIRSCTRQAILAVMEEELSALCGKKYDPSSESACFRAGSTPGTIYVNGSQETLRRPRVRELGETGSTEVSLKSWQAAKDPEEWEQALMKAVLCGVSCRDHAQLRSEELRGLSRSQVSRLWATKAGALVHELNERDLSGFQLTVLMLDGCVLSEDLHALVALGIDTEGTKQVLGFVIAGSENAEASKELMGALIARGLKAVVKKPLGVLDGSKALRQGLLTHWPDAHIQRCLVHKERNLRGYLSKRHHGALARYFKRLRATQGEEAATEVLNELTEFLRSKNQAARESLTEGVAEMLTIFRLGIPATLNVTLLSTNHIENVMRNLRKHLGRVKRWRGETDMPPRWVASGLLTAEKGFRRVRGYQDLPLLIEVLNR